MHTSLPLSPSLSLSIYIYIRMSVDGAAAAPAQDVLHLIRPRVANDNNYCIKHN